MESSGQHLSAHQHPRGAKGEGVRHWQGVVHQSGGIFGFIFECIIFRFFQQFEDLDEIIARHVQPMAGFAQDIMSYKYYMEDVYSEEIGAIEAYLHEEKKRAPTRIP